MAQQKRNIISGLGLKGGTPRYPPELINRGVIFGQSVLKGVIGTSSLGKEVGLDISIAEAMLIKAINSLP